MDVCVADISGERERGLERETERVRMDGWVVKNVCMRVYVWRVHREPS